MYASFVDYGKAFDSVYWVDTVEHTTTLWDAQKSVDIVKTNTKECHAESSITVD